MPKKPTYDELEQRVRELEVADTEHKKIIESLWKKEKRYRNLFEHMLHEVHIWELVFDDNSNIITWKLMDANPAALKSWDKTLSEVVNKTPDEMFPDSGATEQFMPIVKKIFTEGTPYIWESHFPDTNQILHMVSIPLGEFFISTGLDITERRQTEEALRQNHEMLKRTEAIAHIGSWEWEIETDTVTWSEELYRIFQLDPDGETPNWAQHPKLFHPEDFEKLRQAVETTIANGKPYELELRFFRKDGEIRICKAIGFPETGKGGDVVHLFGLLHDITEQKIAEEKLKQYSDHLEELVKERTQELERAQKELLLKERLAVLGNIAGSLAHEIRNPLAAIDSAIYLLKMKVKNGDEKTLQLYGRISSNIKKAIDIIESLLNLSQMDKPRTKRYNLSDFISGIVASADIPDSVEVIIDCSEYSVFIDADAEQIRMAMKNVLNNAVQAMNSEGKIIISMRDSETGYVILSVADTGPGIPPENLEKIFEPLFSTKVHGIGFGLSLVKMIIENHGGTVSAESVSDGGATLIFNLPISKDNR